MLHLKSAAIAIDDETLIVYPSYVDLTGVGARPLEPDPEEPRVANVVQVGEMLLVDASAPRSIVAVAEHVEVTVPVSVDEFAKADGASAARA